MMWYLQKSPYPSITTTTQPFHSKVTVTKPQACGQSTSQIPQRLLTNKVTMFMSFKKKRDTITYLHKAAFSPVPSTWVDVIEHGFFTSWPGLTTKLVEKNLPKSSVTVKGHLRQIQQNLRTTQTKQKTPPTLNKPVMTTEFPSAPVRAKM